MFTYNDTMMLSMMPNSLLRLIVEHLIVLSKCFTELEVENSIKLSKCQIEI